MDQHCSGLAVGGGGQSVRRRQGPCHEVGACIPTMCRYVCQPLAAWGGARFCSMCSAVPLSRVVQPALRCAALQEEKKEGEAAV